MSKKYIFKNFRMLRNRLDISKMFSNKFAVRVVERKSKERLSTNVEEVTEEIEYEIKF